MFFCLLAAAVSAAEFPQADSPRAWSFPRDHGSHPDFQTEWWYFTGNLSTPDGRPFGYQFTIFRRAMIPDVVTTRPSAWAARDIFMGHVALSDLGEKRYLHDSAALRPALGMAGASTDTLAVHLGEWRVEPEGEGWRMRVVAPSFRYDLHLSAEKPPVLNGPGGLDQKGPLPGQASYYYSMTRLATTGTVTVSGRELPVRGMSWMDHEFGSNQLSPEQTGWDWFALQLFDGSELMLYNLRRQNNTVETHSGGTLVRPDGTSRLLTPADYRIEVTDRWKSPHTGAVYPAGWRVKVPPAELDLTIAPRMADQELRTTVPTEISYWEGAVSGGGTHAGGRVELLGYVEMTGYTESMAGRF